MPSMSWDINHIMNAWLFRKKDESWKWRSWYWKNPSHGNGDFKSLKAAFEGDAGKIRTEKWMILQFAWGIPDYACIYSIWYIISIRNKYLYSYIPEWDVLFIVQKSAGHTSSWQFIQLSPPGFIHPRWIAEFLPSAVFLKASLNILHIYLGRCPFFNPSNLNNPCVFTRGCRWRLGLCVTVRFFFWNPMRWLGWKQPWIWYDNAGWIVPLQNWKFNVTWPQGWQSWWRLWWFGMIE